MSSPARIRRPGRRPLLRELDADRGVTNIELFFDLVYVFAVTQLSQTLLEHLNLSGVLHTLVLLAMVWTSWVYTTWLTNWFHPDRMPIRLLLLVSTLLGLLMSAVLPEAFGSHGLLFAGCYAVMHIGRCAVAVAGLRSGEPLSRNYQRIFWWCLVSGGVAIAGGLCHGELRAWLFAASVAIDVVGAVTGFVTPGLGRSHTDDWNIDGRHFAERCQAFVLIALGESVVAIGVRTADAEHLGPAQIVAFVSAFAGAVGLWWLYFDRTATEGADAVVNSTDPGRLGRSAYHQIHPIMVAGIIVVAASDERALESLTHPVGSVTVALALSGTALFIAGHALYVFAVWHFVAWTHVVAIAVLGVLGVWVEDWTTVGLAPTVAVVVLLLCVAQSRFGHPARRPAARTDESS